MIAKIIQGTDFNGVINYMISKPDDKAKVLAATGVRNTSANDVAHDFNLQTSMRPNVQKAVCHTILSFSANDAERLTDAMMVKIANEYLLQMGYADTQSLIVRHSDRQHPHLHIALTALATMARPLATATRNIAPQRFAEN